MFRSTIIKLGISLLLGFLPLVCSCSCRPNAEFAEPPVGHSNDSHDSPGRDDESDTNFEDRAETATDEASPATASEESPSHEGRSTSESSQSESQTTTEVESDATSSHEANPVRDNNTPPTPSGIVAANARVRRMLKDSESAESRGDLQDAFKQATEAWSVADEMARHDSGSKSLRNECEEQLQQLGQLINAKARRRIKSKPHVVKGESP